MSASDRAIRILQSINIVLPITADIENKTVLIIKNSSGDKVLSADFGGNVFTRKFLYEVALVVSAINAAKTTKEIAVTVKIINKLKNAFKKSGIKDELTKIYSVTFNADLMQDII